MKRHHKAFWIALRAAVAALLCWLASPAMAAADGASNAYTVSSTSSGPVIRFSDFDWVMDTGFAIPAGGWTRGPAERLWSLPELHSQAGDYRAVFARFRFDRAALGQGPLALFTQDNREQVLIYVNGVDLFRNFARADDKVQAWCRPYLVPVPERLLHPGVNEIVMRVSTNYDLKVGPVMLGPDDALRPIFERQHFWRVAAPSAANYVMLAIGGIALPLWARRRREWELLFVALTAVLWFAVDYHYVADVLPFDQTLYSAMSNYGIYFAMWASYSFCWLFVDAPHKWRLIWAMLAFGVIILALRLADLIATKGFFLAMIGMSGFTALLAWQGLRSSRAIEHRLVAYVLAIGIAASIHDLGRVAEVHWWQGLDFYFLPFTGLVFCLMFLFFFLRRAMAAFTALEDVNHTLEARVAEARSELVASEEKRRALEVAQAIDSERSRLMREMHDGIGSNLVTALAVAEQQKQPRETIATLRRALADLKLTVDSLEPVEGDLVALLANLRHRMGSDLREAGLTCRWSVQNCDPLPWLDATNALHVLRIFQEAIGNALMHAQADELEIGCHPETRDGRAGLAAFVRDNGLGFTPLPNGQGGKGLNHIRERTLSLHGQFTCDSAPGQGTRLTIWLPYER